MIAGRRPWLWIMREMPWPVVSGDRVYSSGLVRAVADAGIKLRVLAHAGPGREIGPRHPLICWQSITGGTRSPHWVALTGQHPVTAGIHDTGDARAQLERVLVAQRFDAIVFDQLGSGWALDLVAEACARLHARDLDMPKLIYLAHNHETKVWADMAAHAGGSWLRRLVVRRNAAKVARLERRLVHTVDTIACITHEDARAFTADGAERAPVVITPGYDGRVVGARTIDDDTPRRVAMVGSFDWAIKQENLRQFLAAADPLFAAAGVHFDVVGKVPDGLRSALEPRLKATTLHGFVDDPSSIFARARLAVVPELIGGGFKLKLLDYLFSRMPVASIAAAVAGMPDELRSRMILADDCEGLARAILAAIDDTADLDRRQQESFMLASAAYRWLDRGMALRDSVYGAPLPVEPEAPLEALDDPRSGSTNGRSNMAASSRQVA
ncbi:MAG: glycosyltransferase [Burkholderiaceae bacterium]